MCENCSMTLDQSKFEKNYASVGGAIIMKSFAYLKSSAVFFTQNTANELAGALYVTTLSHFSIEATTFE